MRLTFVFLFLSSILLAQDFDNYQLLQNQGTIPEDFTTPSTKKYESEILNMEKDLRAREKKDQQQFYLETYFVVDDLLQSGKVLFGTPVNDYVNRVMDKLLVHEPELKDVVRVYILRSSAVNAFATNQGIIFVNMGLLAQLENEAQLAFILAHELTHVKKSHSLNMYMEKKNINRQMSRNTLLRQADFDEALIAKNRYSKELEFEADQGGLDIYLKTDYSVSELNGVFDVLKYAHLLFDIEEFDTAFFNVGTMVLPQQYFLDSLKPIAAIDEDDEESTHPSTDKRLKKILKDVANVDNSSRKAFLVSNDEFQKIRKIARFELVYYYLHYFRYEDAIYTAYLLMKEHPESKYLKKSVVKALHGMVKYLNAEAKDREDADYQVLNTTYEDIEGPQQQVYYLISQLENSEITTLSLRYAWEIAQEFPNDKELEVLLESLFEQLAYHHEDLSDFKVATLEEIQDIIAGKVVDSSAVVKEEKSASDKIKSKYDKIRKAQKEKAPSVVKFAFEEYALGDVLENTAFKEGFGKGKESNEASRSRRKYYDSYEGQQALKKRNRERAKKGTYLGIDSVLVLSPYYLSLNARKENAFQYVKTEKGHDRLLKYVEKTAEAANMHYVILDVASLSKEDVEKFNDIALLNDWFSQQARIGDWIMPGFSQEQVDQLVEKYGTRYVLKLGVINLKGVPKDPITSSNGLLLAIVYGGIATTIVIPLLATVITANPVIGIPLLVGTAAASLALFLKPRHETLYYGILFDIKNQRYEAISYDVIRKKDTNEWTSSYIYNIFHQIQRSQP